MDQSQDMGQSAGGISQTIADTNSGLMKVMEMVQAKYPDIAQKIGSSIQMFQEAIEDLSQPEGAEAQGKPMPAVTSQEAGVANVQPTL